MHILRALLPFVYFFGLMPAFVGLIELSNLAASWGLKAPTIVVVAGGIGLLILWCILMVRSVHQANDALRQREIARANISAAWQLNSATPLDVDLKKPTLGRVPLGGDIQRLSFLGPAEDAESSPEGHLGYDSRGIYLEMRDGQLVGFDLDVDPFLKSPGAAILAAGFGTKIRPDASEAELVAVLGAPFWRAKDEGSVTLFFERLDGERWLELRLDFDGTGRLESIAASDTPMLAEAYWRRRWGVTSDWPPGDASRMAS
ncbi:MAG: hypothetical protein JXB05_04170 [Myxococcaceae bacterium]|nr:hypothetical protein [Myxococcaceae bacterium]